MSITNRDFDRVRLRVSLRTARRNTAGLGQSSDANPLLAGLSGQKQGQIAELGLAGEAGGTRAVWEEEAFGPVWMQELGRIGAVEPATVRVCQHLLLLSVWRFTLLVRERERERERGGSSRLYPLISKARKVERKKLQTLSAYFKGAQG